MLTPNHLRYYFQNYLSTDSIFTKMTTLGAPWDTSVGQDMDDAYFTMYSGVKNPSEFVLLHLNPDSNDTANSLTIARILYGIYGENWTRLWEAFKAQYTPIDNYSIKEDTTRTSNDERTINKVINRTDASDETDTTQYGHTLSVDATSKGYNYGFNSAEKVPTGETDDTSTETNGGTDTTTTTATGTSKDIDDTTDMNEENETISRTRVGNTGQNTYQDLLRQEFELWRWNFFTQVFEDVDKFLVLSVYSDCQHVSQPI